MSSYYKRGGVEAISVIENWGLGFHVGNAVKYLCRAGHKDPQTKDADLRKAVWYLRRAADIPAEIPEIPPTNVFPARTVSMAWGLPPRLDRALRAIFWSDLNGAADLIEAERGDQP